jgi:hypothetical protein
MVPGGVDKNIVFENKQVIDFKRRLKRTLRGFHTRITHTTFKLWE